MVKQNIHNMQQPQLGQKIQEWRKAKGMTQEELVERCNINVRTIQRIEAGEVTPRFYTVKAILEVLEISPMEVHDSEINDQSPANAAGLLLWLKWAFVAGIIYLVFAMVESVVDIQLLAGEKYTSVGFAYFYSFLKLSILVLFTCFTRVFYKLGEVFSNLLLKIMAVMLILWTGIVLLEDMVTYWLGIDLVSGLIVRSLISGVLYVLFAAAFLQLSRSKGATFIVVGSIGIVTGICFMSVVFAIPGLIFLTVFEIALVVLIYQEYKKVSPEESDNSFGKEPALL
jgi:transcriptional regulator with XRE-family HTH domain